ncbi:MAG TPA: hypothetical protein VGV61_12005, partial [Thermoanaerobaculia bacterium]|nr:hypothetical protein [Thermoanaerobaculia bacterium]
VGAISRVAESARHLFQRPDAPRLHRRPYGTSLDGLAAETRLSRVDGALRWDLSARGVSPGFDVDEVGFQRQSDWVLLAGRWSFERFPAAGALRHWTVGGDNLGLGWTWGGERRAATVDGYLELEGRSYWYAKLGLTHDLPVLSVDRLRGGPALLLPPRDGVALSLSTDQRRASTATVDLRAAREPGSGSWSASFAPGVDVRASTHVRWSVAPSLAAEAIGWQAVGSIGSAGATRYLVGRVTQRTLAVALRTDVVVSPRLVLQLYARPFATVGRYDRFQLLSAPRASTPAARFTAIGPGRLAVDSRQGSLGVDLDGDGALDGAVPLPGGEERSLDVNAVLRWEYRPGSSLIVAWAQRRSGEARAVDRSPSAALGGLRDDPATSVGIVKLSFRVGG